MGTELGHPAIPLRRLCSSWAEPRQYVLVRLHFPRVQVHESGRYSIRSYTSSIRHQSPIHSKGNRAIPTLLGKLLFLRPDSDDELVRNEYFCLVSGLLIPWTRDQSPVKASTDSWEKFFSIKKE